MNPVRNGLVTPKHVKVVAAVLVGLGIGALVPPDPVVVPWVGAVPGLLAGGAGLVSGTVLYTRGPGLLATSECGCGGECTCA